MASKLEEFLNFIEIRRYQDAVRCREDAQKEYYEAKNKLGLHGRKECENMDKLFSYVEQELYDGARALLSKANDAFQSRIKPEVQSLHGAGKKSLESAETTHKVDVTRIHQEQTNSKTEQPNSKKDGKGRQERHETYAKDFDDLEIKSTPVSPTSNDQRMRASKEASEKLRKDNPNIADLSDTNRPTKIAEKFSELYDNEWTEAYIDLTENHKQLTERKTVDMLYIIVLAAYNFCQKEACRQIQQMQEAVISIVTHGHVSFLESQTKQFSHVKQSRVLENFVVKAVEITWWMCVQNPAVYLHTEEPGIINHNFYKPYTRSGKNVDYFIWPPLLLHENGPLLSKGIVQAK